MLEETINYKVFTATVDKIIELSNDVLHEFMESFGKDPVRALSKIEGVFVAAADHLVLSNFRAELTSAKDKRAYLQQRRGQLLDAIIDLSIQNGHDATMTACVEIQSRACLASAAMLHRQIDALLNATEGVGDGTNEGF